MLDRRGFLTGLFSASLEEELQAETGALSDITRRAFVPRLFVQIYQASPVLAQLRYNAQERVVV